MKYFSLLCSMYLAMPLAIAAPANKNSLGIELDALPYITGGYYLSGWYGKQHLRFRGVVASVNIPEFAIKDGYKNNTLDAVAIIVDYFPKLNFEGIWYGAGLEAWSSKITADSDNSSADYNNYVLTVGAGYAWYFHPKFYLNPWFALHGIIGGDNTVNVGSKVFEPERITGEISIKLGFKY